MGIHNHEITIALLMTKTLFYGIMIQYQGDVPFWAALGFGQEMQKAKGKQG